MVEGLTYMTYALFSLSLQFLIHDNSSLQTLVLQNIIMFVNIKTLIVGIVLICKRLYVY